VIFTPVNTSGSHQWLTLNPNALFSSQISVTKDFTGDVNNITIKHIRNFGGNTFSTTKTIALNLITLGVSGQTTSSNSISSLSNGGLILGKNISVSGKLVLDKPFSFENCTFRMNSGSEIKIAPSIKLTTLNSKFKGCTQMWKGIRQDLHSDIDITGSEISDAEYGIRLASHSDVAIQSTHFVNCAVGVLHLPDLNASGSAVEGVVTQTKAFIGNTFEQIGTPLPNYVGQNTITEINVDPIITANLVSTIPIGICLKNLKSFKVGTLSGTPATQWSNKNLFKNLNFGICAINSSINVAASQFQNLRLFGIEAYQEGGYDKYTFNLTGFGGIATSNPTFGDCESAIVTALPGKISNCKIERAVFGINFTAYYNKKLFIQNNYIDVALPNIIPLPPYTSDYPFSGIYGLFGNNMPSLPLLKSVQIKENEIHYTGVSENNFVWNKLSLYLFIGRQEAIYLNNFSAAPNIKIEVSKNQIFMTKGRIGIANVYCNDASIYDNDVWMDNPQLNLQGISLLEAHGTKVQKNRIHGSGTNPSVLQTKGFWNGGIYVESTSNGVLDCNDVTGPLNHGLTFNKENKSPNNYGTTTFLGSDILLGLVVEQNSSTDMQQDKGNLFSSSNSMQEAVNFGNILLSPFSAFAPSSGISDFTPNPVTPTMGWFSTSLNTNTQIGCLTPLNAPFISTGGTGESTVTNVDVLTAKGLINYTEHQQNNIWTAQHNLLKKLILHPNIINTQPDVNNFWLSKSNSPMAELIIIENDFSNLRSNVDETNWNNLAQIELLIDTKNQQIEAVDLSIDGFGAGSPTSSLINQKKQLVDELSDLQTQATTIWSQIETQLQFAVAQIKLKNSAIIPSSIQETNLKSYYSIFLDNYFEKRIQFNSSEKLTLEGVAAQCYDDGGSAVLLARSILQAANQFSGANNTFFADNCGNNVSPESNFRNSISKTDFLVWPNPTSDVLNIKKPEIQGLIYCNVYDISGRKIDTFKLEDGVSDFQFDVSGYQNGLYFIQFAGLSGLKVEKISIFH
jgi:hypothetical protein